MRTWVDLKLDENHPRNVFLGLEQEEEEIKEREKKRVIRADVNESFCSRFMIS